MKKLTFLILILFSATLLPHPTSAGGRGIAIHERNIAPRVLEMGKDNQLFMEFLLNFQNMVEEGVYLNELTISCHPAELSGAAYLKYGDEIIYDADIVYSQEENTSEISVSARTIIMTDDQDHQFSIYLDLDESEDPQGFYASCRLKDLIFDYLGSEETSYIEGDEPNRGIEFSQGLLPYHFKSASASSAGWHEIVNSFR